jgi:hypothetical protein
MTSPSVTTADTEDSIDAARVGKFMCVVPPKVRGLVVARNLTRKPTQLSRFRHPRRDRWWPRSL